MRAIPCFVILSLLACKGAEPNVGSAASNPGAPPDAPVAAQGDVGPVSHGGLDTASQRDTPPLPQTPPQAERKPVRLIEYRGDALSPVPYRVVEPDDASATTPIVLALHGRGDTAAGFMQLARRLELEARVIVAEAPLPFGNIGGRQWFETATAEALRPQLDALDALLADFGKRHPEAGRPILLGFSQGAMLVMLALAERPERYRAGVALSGRLVERPADSAAAGTGAAASGTGARREETPVLVVAGTKDGIIPQEASWAAADQLAQLGRTVERFGFVGAHSVPPAAIEAVRLFVAKVTAPPPTSPPSAPASP